LNSPIALLLLKERITDWMANATGNKYFGLGYACSRYTTSEPDLFGKYDAYSRYTANDDREVNRPSDQKIILKPTEPVPFSIADATFG
jgi:hypothetical protein